MVDDEEAMMSSGSSNSSGLVAAAVSACQGKQHQQQTNSGLPLQCVFLVCVRKRDLIAAAGSAVAYSSPAGVNLPARGPGGCSATRRKHSKGVNKGTGLIPGGPNCSKVVPDTQKINRAFWMAHRDEMAWGSHRIQFTAVEGGLQKDGETCWSTDGE